MNKFSIVSILPIKAIRLKELLKEKRIIEVEKVSILPIKAIRLKVFDQEIQNLAETKRSQSFQSRL